MNSVLFPNKEIEEIKLRWDTAFPNDRQAHKDIQFLLSSLEKEKELRARAEWEGGWAIDPEYYVSKVELEKEKKQTDYFRLEVNRLTNELAKAKERIKELETDALYLRRYREMFHKNPQVPCACVIDEDGQWIKKCEFHEEIVNRLEEKISELDDRIEKLVILIDEYAGRIMKGKERVKELEEAILFMVLD